jgi:hypothetical protein
MEAGLSVLLRSGPNDCKATELASFPTQCAVGQMIRPQYQDPRDPYDSEVLGSGK